MLSPFRSRCSIGGVKECKKCSPSNICLNQFFLAENWIRSLHLSSSILLTTKLNHFRIFTYSFNDPFSNNSFIIIISFVTLLNQQENIWSILSCFIVFKSSISSKTCFWLVLVNFFIAILHHATLLPSLISKPI